MHGRRRGQRKEAAAGCGSAPAAARAAPAPKRCGDSVSPPPLARPRSPRLAGRGAGGSGGSRDCGVAAPRAPSNEGAAATASRLPDPTRLRVTARGANWPLGPDRT